VLIQPIALWNEGGRWDKATGMLMAFSYINLCAKNDYDNVYLNYRFIKLYFKIIIPGIFIYF